MCDHVITASCKSQSTVKLQILQSSTKSNAGICSSFLFVTNESIYFLEVDSLMESPLLLEELLRRSSLRSFASLRRIASSFAYSAASSRFFSKRLRFRASLALLRCRTIGVTSRCILGAFDLGFFPTEKKKSKTVLHLCNEKLIS